MLYHALRLWTTIVQIEPKASKVGEILLSAITSLKTGSQITRTIVDIFASKATRALARRVCHIVKFISWCKLSGISPFPVVESVFYAFLYDNIQAPATFSSSMRESLNFAGGVIGLQWALEVALSPHIIGFSHRCQLNKRPLKQCKPLTVKHVTTLESAFHDTPDLLDKMFIDHCIFTLSARSR